MEFALDNYQNKAMNLSPKLLPENMNLQKKISEDTEKKNVCTSTFFPIATYYILKYA